MHGRGHGNGSYLGRFETTMAMTENDTSTLCHVKSLVVELARDKQPSLLKAHILKAALKQKQGTRLLRNLEDATEAEPSGLLVQIKSEKRLC